MSYGYGSRFSGFYTRAGMPILSTGSVSSMNKKRKSQDCTSYREQIRAKERARIKKELEDGGDKTMDLIASFEEFLLRKNPNICLVCWGEGKLVATLPITGLKHEITCPRCSGIGELPKFQINKDGTVTCRCGESMCKVTFPDIGLCWSCKCGEYIVIEDKEV